MRSMPSPVRAEPNVTPMIDVMLVLLIIFMAIGPLLVDGFQAAPPVGIHVAAHPDEEKEAVIGVDARGRYFFNKVEVSEAALRSVLDAWFKANPGDAVAYLRADKDLTFEQVQTALDIAATAGARKVGLVTELPPSGDRPRP